MSSVKRFVARYKVEEMRMQLGDESIGMWRTVVRALELTPRQTAATAQLWRTFR